MQLRKILCPIDFSAGSRQAFDLAATLAMETKAEIVLLHAWQPPYAMSPELPTTLVTQLRTDTENELAKWRAELERRGVRGSTKLVLGAPWDQICDYANVDKATDLIVIGTQGRTGIKRVLLGSVAEKVVRHAPCPVLVARARE